MLHRRAGRQRAARGGGVASAHRSLNKYTLHTAVHKNRVAVDTHNVAYLSVDIGYVENQIVHADSAEHAHAFAAEVNCQLRIEAAQYVEHLSEDVGKTERIA